LGTADRSEMGTWMLVLGQADIRGVAGVLVTKIPFSQPVFLPSINGPCIFLTYLREGKRKGGMNKEGMREGGERGGREREKRRESSKYKESMAGEGKGETRASWPGKIDRKSQ